MVKEKTERLKKEEKIIIIFWVYGCHYPESSQHKLQINLNQKSAKLLGVGIQYKNIAFCSTGPSIRKYNVKKETNYKMAA